MERRESWMSQIDPMRVDRHSVKDFQIFNDRKCDKTAVEEAMRRFQISVALVKLLSYPH